MIIDEQIEKLKEASKLENTELGEAWLLLTEIHRYNYIFSKEFKEAIVKEIQYQSNDLNENFEIVEIEEMPTKPKTYKELRLKNEC
jgi:hypothetical protein